jgi:membrane peptidoglycan carboxypeptidase
LTSDTPDIALDRPPAPEPARFLWRRLRRRRRRIALAVVAGLVAAAGAGAAGWVSSVDVPPLAVPDRSTIVYFSDGRTVLGRLGTRRRIAVDTATLPPHVVAAVLAARDPDFRTGGLTHRPSLIAREYARMVTGTPSGATGRIVTVAAKLEARYGKERVLDAYLNAVPFGRYADGIQAAAYAYFGRPATALTADEAVFLAGRIGSPDAGGATGPAGPAGSATGLAGPAGPVAHPAFPNSLVSPEVGAASIPDGHATGPRGHIVSRLLRELAATVPELRGKGRAAIADGGYAVVSTVDPSRQSALERYADETLAGSALNAQPANLQAAAVAVEPRTGRIVAYFGGHNGSGVDYAGAPHTPGASFAVYPLAAALAAGISVRSTWDARSPQSFIGRSKPLVNAEARCATPDPARTTLADAVRCGLNVPLYAVTDKVGPGRVVDLARAAGIDEIRADDGRMIDLSAFRSGNDVAPRLLNTEIGIGQYGITVVDHANGMATFAAGGERARAHLVASVTRGGKEVYHENLATTRAGLTDAQADDLTWTLNQDPLGRLPDARQTATIGGTWQLGPTSDRAHAWIAGYTPQLALAVWVGNKDAERALKDRAGAPVTAATLPAEIYRGFLSAALVGVPPAAFAAPTFVGDAGAGTAGR